MNLDGTGTTQIVDNKKIGDLETDGTFVYWTIQGSNAFTTDGSIERLQSGTSSPVVALHTGIASGAISVNATSLFWANTDGSTLNQSAKAPMASSMPLLNSVLVYALVSDDSSLWARTTDGLSFIPFGQSTTVTITAPPGLNLRATGSYLAIDASHVYAWFGQDSSSPTHLVQMTKPSLASPVELAQAKAGQAMRSFAGYIYFVDSDGLYRVSVDKSAGATRIAASTAAIAGMVVADGAVYWAENGTALGTGTIKKLAVF
jgi:hypothetical protein